MTPQNKPIFPLILAFLCLCGTIYCLSLKLFNLAFIMPFLTVLFAGIAFELYKENKPEKQ